MFDSIDKKAGNNSKVIPQLKMSAFPLVYDTTR